jgi:YD repeat-containing protein
LQTGPVFFTRDAQNGRVTGSTATNVLDTVAYDGFGAVNHYDARDGAGSLLSRDYVRDNGGRITQVTESLLGGPNVVTAYGYDSAGRLASVTRGASAVTYGYDPNGNRTQLSGVNLATYDAQDRMLTYGANTYEYTAGGNLSLKSTLGGNTQYTYDLYGSLRQATLPDGTVLDYLVDGTHRRVGKKRNGVLEHAWLYDGQLRPIFGASGLAVFGNEGAWMSYARAGVGIQFRPTDRFAIQPELNGLWSVGEATRHTLVTGAVGFTYGAVH